MKPDHHLTICPNHNPSNLGKWTAMFQSRKNQRFGAVTSYECAAEFLADCESVEDWGCGLGMFKNFCRSRYVGIDGTKTEHCDLVADLASYRSRADGILIRHVLEHNVLWQSILQNAVESFQKKMCLVLFTPLAETTRVLAYKESRDVYDLALSETDLTSHFAGLKWWIETISDGAAIYGGEQLFYLER
jgi:hypothetical protein